MTGFWPFTYLTPLCSVAAQNLASASHRGGHRGADAPAAFSEALAALGGDAEDVAECIVDAARGRVKVCVHTDGRDAVFHQQRRHIIGGQTFDGLEDDWMVADNKLAVILDRLPHDRGGDVQRGQHAVHRLTRIDQQADIVPAEGQLLRSRRLQQT